MNRFRAYLESRGWWSDAAEQEMRDTERYQVLQALARAEKRSKPDISDMFEDVYKDKPPHLAQQERELKEHLAKYPEHYQKDAPH